MTHPQFKSQSEYDKNSSKMKKLRNNYFNKKYDYDAIYEKLIKQGFGKWGALHTINVWNDQILLINKLKKKYINRKIKGGTVIAKLLRIASFDKFESEKLMEAWDNEPKKEKGK